MMMPSEAERLKTEWVCECCKNFESECTCDVYAEQEDAGPHVDAEIEDIGAQEEARLRFWYSDCFKGMKDG